ncbi:unnamed protein product [Bursaphelenchus okinawaensis]|uniref:CUB domain-containing protein n=1 Tax=Bursaphelenchus okinawaensis TaxID=465554 RepID=A0A811JS62_9BILA|nr:unnamed protein product [Bursaphelenchus okinawaensis]CAG9080527.1 unnamed protein product [Bursaphelenchus okinawaensis]
MNNKLITVFFLLCFTQSFQCSNVPETIQAKFYGCVAKCGQEFGHETTEILLSGKNHTKLIVTETEIEKCKKVCTAVGDGPADEAGFSYDSRKGYDDLDLACANKITLFPPRIQAKFSLGEEDDDHLLRVIEIWRIFAYKDGHLNSTLVSRNRFSSRFEVEYEYSNVQIKEYLMVRVYSFDNNGLAKKPQCSGEVTPDKLFNGRRDMLQLKLVDLFDGASKALIEWNSYDNQYPAECEQFVNWSSGSEVGTKQIELDTTHRFIIPLKSDPKTRVHVISVYSISESAFSDRQQAVLNIDLNNNHLKKKFTLSKRKTSVDVQLLFVIGFALVVSALFLCVVYKINTEQKMKKQKMHKMKKVSFSEFDSDIIPEMITPIKPKKSIYQYDNTVNSTTANFTPDTAVRETRILPFQLNSTHLSYTKSAPCQMRI